MVRCLDVGCVTEMDVWLKDCWIDGWMINGWMDG